MILGPLREGLKIFKWGQMLESWIEAAEHEKFKEALEKVIANVHWIDSTGDRRKQIRFYNRI